MKIINKKEIIKQLRELKDDFEELLAYPEIIAFEELMLGQTQINVSLQLSDENIKISNVADNMIYNQIHDVMLDESLQKVGYEYVKRALEMRGVRRLTTVFDVKNKFDNIINQLEMKEYNINKI